jgi:phospholysine phosphohistidine inorganic pyrophosphate phosphatase
MPPAFLFDLDGTLYTNDGAIEGAVDTVAAIRRRGVPVRFITNTTANNRRGVMGRLTSYGFEADDGELFTPAVAAGSLFRRLGIDTVAPFVAPLLLEDLGGLDLRGGVADQQASPAPGAVLIGDLGDAWSAELLNEAFRHVMDGARLVALHKGRYWMAPGGLTLDVGAYVAALEFATGREAIVCGKPQEPFFDAVLRSLGLERPFADVERPVMVGDDVWNDVEGAQRAGLAGWLVQTGKFRDDALAESGVSPDRIVASVVEVI